MEAAGIAGTARHAVGTADTPNTHIDTAAVAQALAAAAGVARLAVWAGTAFESFGLHTLSNFSFSVADSECEALKWWLERLPKRLQWRVSLNMSLRCFGRHTTNRTTSRL